VWELLLGLSCSLRCALTQLVFEECGLALCVLSIEGQALVGGGIQQAKGKVARLWGAPGGGAGA
jgi:hypothetical protein